MSCVTVVALGLRLLCGLSCALMCMWTGAVGRKWLTVSAGGVMYLSRQIVLSRVACTGSALLSVSVVAFTLDLSNRLSVVLIRGRLGPRNSMLLCVSVSGSWKAVWCGLLSLGSGELWITLGLSSISLGLSLLILMLRRLSRCMMKGLTVGLVLVLVSVLSTVLVLGVSWAVSLSSWLWLVVTLVSSVVRLVWALVTSVLRCLVVLLLFCVSVLVIVIRVLLRCPTTLWLLLGSVWKVLRFLLH